MNKELAIFIGDWIEEGCNPGVWFYIMRHETLDNINRHTPNMLISLIEQALSEYGKYEIRKPQFINANEFIFEENYVMLKTLGNVNGATAQVVTMYTEARIIDESE